MSKKSDEEILSPVEFPIPFKSDRIKYGRYFTPEKYIKMGKEAMLFTSTRSTGKSVSILCWQLEHFLETGEKFIYVRTMKDTLDLTRDTLMLQPNRLIFQSDPDYFFYVGRKNIVYLHHVEYGSIPAGICIGLSLAEKNKSIDFSEYTSLFLDEAISENASYPWVVPSLLSLLTTIIREREHFLIFIAANNIRVPTEFLQMMNFDPAEFKYGLEGLWTNDKALYANFISEVISDSIRNTTLGALLKDTAYGRMALDNDSGAQDRFRIGYISSYKQMLTSCQGILWYKDEFGDVQAYGLMMGRFKCKREERYKAQAYHSGQIFAIKGEDKEVFLQNSRKSSYRLPGMREKMNVPLAPLDYKSTFKKNVDNFIEWWIRNKNTVMFDTLESYSALTHILPTR